MVRRSGVLVLAFVMVLGACGRRPKEVMSPTAGQITVYTSIVPRKIETYLAVFRAEYPDIEINLVQDRSDVIAQRLLDGRGEPQADVLWGLSATHLVFLEWHDLLAPYAPSGLKALRPPFRDTSNPPHWVGFDAWMNAFCVNTAVLKQLGLPTPQSWQDLTEPIYAGRLGMPDPTRTSIGYMAIAAILQLYGEIRGWEWLDALHRNVALYTASAEPCELVASGDLPIVISYGLDGLGKKVKGVPLDVVFRTEGSGWDMEANALVKKDRVKPAAKTFLDWTISAGAMQEYAKHHAVTAMPVDAPMAGFPRDPWEQLIDKDFPWATANRERILREWQRRYNDKAGKSAQSK